MSAVGLSQLSSRGFNPHSSTVYKRLVIGQYPNYVSSVCHLHKYVVKMQYLVQCLRAVLGQVLQSTVRILVVDPAVEGDVFLPSSQGLRNVDSIQELDRVRELFDFFSPPVKILLEGGVLSVKITCLSLVGPAPQAKI